MSARLSGPAAALMLSLSMAGSAWGQTLQGDLRDNFVAGFTRSCIARASRDLSANAAFMAKAGITEDKLAAFCRCESEQVADTITPDDFGVLAKTHAPNDSVRRLIAAAHVICRHLLTE